jgi:maltooligosyltrehalose trehalohydrolase
LEDRAPVELDLAEDGYHVGTLGEVSAGVRYRYVLDGGHELPDPASRWQPDGVDGPSAVDDPAAFAWTDAGWRGVALDRILLYELHVGTFTPAGTFETAIERLDDLGELGVTAVEVMPVAQFPGERNWGYDGVFPDAVQASYGGPDGLRRFVDACHARGLAAVLDVVDNHLGPEGNVLGAFGPYFTDRYRSPWGEAINVDGRGSDEVRRLFLENARMWFEDFHLDGLRLDAIHGIVDTSATPFLSELSASVEELQGRLGRPLHLIAESDRNDAKVVAPRDLGGLGMASQWADDLHHGLHALLTGERGGYYADFGGLEDLATALRRGWTYDGRGSRARGRRHGNSPAGLGGERFVVSAQNHDQVGNRARGERLSDLIDLEGVKLAAATVLLSPFIPLLFMGEEYGETAPFPYFVSHRDPGLVEAVREGRARDFEAFAWEGDQTDPGAEETFLSAKLDHRLKQKEPHRSVFALHRELLRLRRGVAAFRDLRPDLADVRADERSRSISIRRPSPEGDALVLLAFGDEPLPVPVPSGRWRPVLDTADARWAGPGGASLEPAEGGSVLRPPRSAAAYIEEQVR